jgi:predicted nucleic acid-binding protein
VRVLLDTCVVSELARPNADRRVLDHVAALRSEDLYLSVLTIGEIAAGVARLEQGARRTSLERFLLRLEQDWSERVLPIDVETAHIWGETAAAARRRGRTIPAVEGLLAATAQRHGLQVMTRNVADFSETGVAVIDPWC